MGESLWAVDKEVRRTCIVSENEAARILEDRRSKKQSVDDSWLCRLD
jgi:hypothetical protein